MGVIDIFLGAENVSEKKIFIPKPTSKIPTPHSTS